MKCSGVLVGVESIVVVPAGNGKKGYAQVSFVGKGDQDVLLKAFVPSPDFSRGVNVSALIQTLQDMAQRRAMADVVLQYRLKDNGEPQWTITHAVEHKGEVRK